MRGDEERARPPRTQRRGAGGRAVPGAGPRPARARGSGRSGIPDISIGASTFALVGRAGLSTVDGPAGPAGGDRAEARRDAGDRLGLQVVVLARPGRCRPRRHAGDGTRHDRRRRHRTGRGRERRRRRGHRRAGRHGRHRLRARHRARVAPASAPGRAAAAGPAPGAAGPAPAGVRRAAARGLGRLGRLLGLGWLGRLGRLGRLRRLGRPGLGLSPDRAARGAGMSAAGRRAGTARLRDRGGGRLARGGGGAGWAGLERDQRRSAGGGRRAVVGRRLPRLGERLAQLVLGQPAAGPAARQTGPVCPVGRVGRRRVRCRRCVRAGLRPGRGVALRTGGDACGRR